MQATRIALAVTAQSRKALQGRVLASLTVASLLTAFLVIGVAINAANGQTDVGLAAAAIALTIGQLLMGGGDEELEVTRGAMMLHRAFEALPHARSLGSVRFGTKSASSLPRESIVIDSVSFGYPSSNSPVLSELTLQIPAGRCLALVGANGAGKTTLVKLLLHLYDPQTGRITVDGTDLQTLEMRSWRSRLAVLFQDFCHFDASLAFNVGFNLVSDQEVVVALNRAGASDLLTRVGLSTMCASAYPGGVDPSGGEWQKIALARVLRALEGGAEVLVLDEPTAALDAAAEADFFETFRAITRGKTSVLISHRFSTVRCADQIAVLERGRVTEQGSHTELLARRGRYAEMFHLQASAFGTGSQPSVEESI